MHYVIIGSASPRFSVSGAPLSDLLVREIADDVSGAYAGKCLSDRGHQVGLDFRGMGNA